MLETADKIQTVAVEIPGQDSKRQYKIHVKTGLLESVGKHFDFSRFSSCVVVSDEQVAKHWLPVLLLSLPSTTTHINISPGEQAKNISTLSQLWSEFAARGLDRRSLVINLGGGVIGDIGAFAASTYMRGISFINIPTTLLAQVDASVGGKNGIDHAGAKNIVGTFAQPQAVFIDPLVLQTLPKRELCSGFAEIIKHGVLFAADYFSLATSKSASTFSSAELATLISKSCELKAKIVVSDEREQGPRKLLNLGHTAGHALEAMFLDTATPLLHGEAISLGMLIETKLAVLLGICPLPTLTVLEAGLKNVPLPIRIAQPICSEKFLSLIQRDKKNNMGRVLWSLPIQIGQARYDIEAPSQIVTEALRYIQS